MTSYSGAADAYNAIAPVYDLFTADNDAEGWLIDILNHLERLDLTGNRLLDVGCGTGRNIPPMLARGWQVTACDVSPAMIERAGTRTGNAARLAVADMRELPRLGSFDLVWALDDTINYLLDRDELVEALIGMRDNLASDGLMLFDSNTLCAYRTFGAERHVVERDGLRMIWTGLASPDAEPGSLCEARFEVEGKSQIQPHTHRQRHFPEAEIRGALARAGLQCLDVQGHGLDGVLERPLDEAVHTKAIYIASLPTRRQTRRIIDGTRITLAPSAISLSYHGSLRVAPHSLARPTRFGSGARQCEAMQGSSGYRGDRFNGSAIRA